MVISGGIVDSTTTNACRVRPAEIEERTSMTR
jgi:hypothetical protein